MPYLNGSKRRLTTQLALLGGVDAVTLTGAYTLDEKSSNFLALDPGGASRTVTLPAEETNDGLFFVIENTADADEQLTVANDAGTTVVVLDCGAMAIVGCEGGSAWVVMALCPPVYPFLTRSTIANAGTISDAQMRGGVLYQDASGGNVTMTTRTGTQMAAAFPEMDIGQAAMVRMASNHATNTSTIAGGTDVTLVGSGAVTQTGGSFCLIKTAATTFDLVRVG